MSLQRKPVKTDVPPGYPDSQAYANERRSFLVKLGITAAGLLGLAGCGEATNVQPQGNTAVPTPTSTAPAQWPVFNPPVKPQTAMPGTPPPPNMTNTSAPPPGNTATNSVTPQPSARPQACKPGDTAIVETQPAPARPVAATGGEPVAPEMVKPAPAKKEEK